MTDFSAKTLNPLLLVDDEEIVDVLDLPQLYTRPSAKTLLSVLGEISLKPHSWDITPRSGTPISASGTTTPLRRTRKVRSAGLPQYLTQIISSPLAWITDEAEKEQVWEMAAQRISERSGRSAMGSMNRAFSVPLVASPAGQRRELEPNNMVEVSLYEPALTADNLGLKTWASSYLLARRLCILRASLPNEALQGPVLELGAGTGLVGIAAAAVFRAHVVLTDLPEIVPNLERNVQANAGMVSSLAGSLDVTTLDWSCPAAFSPNSIPSASARSFPFILVADPIYSTEHPRLLVQAIEHHLSKTPEARVVIELPLRDSYVAERQDLRDSMNAIGLTIHQEGEEIGFDDWSQKGNEDEPAEVRCWWSVWTWK